MNDTSNVSSNNPSTSEIPAEDVIQAVADSNGVTILGRIADRTTAPAAETRVTIHVGSDVVDRYEGMSDTWAVWGPSTNKEFVARHLAVPAVRHAVTLFLSNRSLALVLEKMIQVPTIKPSETMFTKPQLFAAFLDVVSDARVAHVLMELVLPGMVEIGAVTDNGRFAQQVTYPFRRVSVRDLAIEIAMVQAFAALKDVKLSSVRKDTRQSKVVFAQDMAEIYRPIGLALGQASELTTVVDDIIRGVRAHLTPPGSIASTNISVPSTWYNNPQIAEFAKCLPFIRAALALPTNDIVRLQNEGSNLDAWLRLTTEMLRESPRYHWVSKAEALRHYTFRKVRDNRGKAVSVVVHRSVRAEPIAQSVIASPDAIMRDVEAYDITGTKDRIAEVVQAAYGRADFSTDNAANLIFGTASDLVSMGFLGIEAGFLVDAYGRGATLSDLAALRADNLYVPFNGDQVVLSERAHSEAKLRASIAERNRREGNNNVAYDLGYDLDPMWWFGVATLDRQLEVQSGTHLGDAILTSDPVEALLAATEVTAKDALPARKQVLGPNAFGARVMNFNAAAFLESIDQRYGFQINLNGNKVSGSFRAAAFSSLRASAMTRLVKPHFNAGVVTTLADGFATALLLIQKAQTSDEWAENTGGYTLAFNQLQERVAIKLLQLAQQLSPSFRQEVQQAVIERVLVATDAKSEEAIALRASLVHDYFTAYSDIIALDFFLALQGIKVNGWAGLLRSEAMERICLTMGSDRKMPAYVS